MSRTGYIERVELKHLLYTVIKKLLLLLTLKSAIPPKAEHEEGCSHVPLHFLRLFHLIPHLYYIKRLRILIGSSMIDLNDLSDDDLVLLAKKESADAFAILVARYAEAVFRTAFSITRNTQDAEDVVQDTFIKASKKIQSYSFDKGSFRVWILTIARNDSLNFFAALKRRAGRFLSGSLENLESASSENFHTSLPVNPEQLLSTKEEMSNISRIIAGLPERQRPALLLKAQDELSYGEIAQVMGTTASSIESLIFRARKKITEEMKINHG